MSAYGDIVRLKLLMDAIEKMPEEEKREYLRSSQDKEVLQGLQRIESKVDKSRYSWLEGFGTNIAGNAVWDGLVWIGSRLLRK